MKYSDKFKATALIILFTLFITTLFIYANVKKSPQRIYPAKVVEKLLISPKEIPVALAGRRGDGEPFYKPGKTKTSHAFVVVSVGRCSVIPVDEAYFHAVDENKMVPVYEKRSSLTGMIIEEGIHYEFGIPSSNN